MQVLILNHYAAPPDHGAGTRHYDLGRVLAEGGHDVTILASSFSHFSLREERLRGAACHRSESLGGVSFVRVRTVPYRRNDLRRVANMASYFLAALLLHGRLPRPDVVIGSSVHPLAALAGYLIARRRRAVFLFEVRDLWPQSLIDMGDLREDGPAARALRRLEAFLFRKARLTISLLPGAGDYIAARGVPDDRVLYLPNGVDLERYDRPAAALAPTLREALDTWRASGKVVAAHCGAHNRAYKLDVLLEAAELLQQRPEAPVQIVLVGAGAEKPRLVQLAKDKRLTNVAFFPPVPKEQMPSLLRRVDINLFHLADSPVYRYGLSANKLFDYLASGRPTVFAARAANNPVAAAGAGVTVPPEDPDALAAAVAALATASEASRAEMGRRGRIHVERHHDVTVLGRRLSETLREVT